MPCSSLPQHLPQVLGYALLPPAPAATPQVSDLCSPRSLTRAGAGQGSGSRGQGASRGAGQGASRGRGQGGEGAVLGSSSAPSGRSQIPSHSWMAPTQVPLMQGTSPGVQLIGPAAGERRSWPQGAVPYPHCLGCSRSHTHVCQLPRGSLAWERRGGRQLGAHKTGLVGRRPGGDHPPRQDSLSAASGQSGCPSQSRVRNRQRPELQDICPSPQPGVAQPGVGQVGRLRMPTKAPEKSLTPERPGHPCLHVIAAGNGSSRLGHGPRTYVRTDLSLSHCPPQERTLTLLI